MYRAFLTYSSPKRTAASGLTLATSASRIVTDIEATGEKWEAKKTVELPTPLPLDAGASRITMKTAGKPVWAFLLLFKIELKPVK